VAEPESDYSWVFGLVVLFFVFVLPILKKVADALAGKKEQQARRTGPPRQEPQKRGVFGEMLDEVEGFFRKSREQQEDKPQVTSATDIRKKEYSPFDLEYRERKREVEERRRRREERQERRRLEAVVRRPEPVQPEGLGLGKILDGAGFREAAIKPVIGDKAESMGSFEILAGEDKITSLAEEKRVEVREESFFEVLGELPDMARMIVLSEVLSQPKSMRSAVEGF
jgi:hypothetical protein